ncbi:MAG: DNA-directed RNA polymerase subunit alpha [Planctomycetes bacterium]|nr:DNA-directed RNA polymerase subunit alpha [Planctomycetota bacterium]
MRIRWRDFEIPNSVVCEEATRSPHYGKFIVEPFERGFGVTIGNSLRRILLSSLEGAAVVSVKIEGVQHEFSTLTGVYEDVTDIVLNIKNLLLLLYDGEETELRIRSSKKGEVRAADIQHGPEVKIVNPDLLIATVTQDVPLNIDMAVRKGRGYWTAEENSRGDSEIGVIWVDSAFSPVSRVRYKTEATRVGQLTNYDRLILEIWTNGTVTPDMALTEASKILRRHLNPFLQYSELGHAVQEDNGLSHEEPLVPQDLEETRRKLELSVTSLDLTVRAQNCLESQDVKTIGDLVRRSEADLLKVRNFGKNTLHEIKTKLREIGLSLGMNVGTAGAAAQ